MTLEYWQQSGPYVVAALVIFSIILTRIRVLKSMSFTAIIFTAVIASLYYPDAFLSVAGFETKSLIIPLLMLIMFGMGTSMNITDFANVLRMPKAVGIGLVCQFTIMPVVGFALALTTGLGPEIAAGIILVGCSPGGLASNVMAYISGANLALSLTLTAISTLLAPFLTPLLMAFYADALVPINTVAMFLAIVKIVILPIVAGLIFNHFFHGKFTLVDRAMPYVSMVGIAVIITIITAAGRDNLLSIGVTLIVAVVVHNIVGYLTGYGAARLMRLDEASSRTIAFEVGMQNSGLASGIALEMGKVATMGLAPAVFGPLMNISGSSLAAWWRSRPPQSDD